MKKFIILIVVIVLAVIVIVALGGKKDTATSTPTPSASTSTSSVPTTSSTASPLVSATVSIGISVPKTVTVSYADDGYSPSTVSIKKGDTVKFVNNSTKDMWPASAVHPTHDVYPEHNTCFSGVFTGCNVAPGGFSSMKFNSVGTWMFHDHRTPSKTGTITVTN